MKLTDWHGWRVDLGILWCGPPSHHCTGRLVVFTESAPASQWLPHCQCVWCGHSSKFSSDILACWPLPHQTQHTTTAKRTERTARNWISSYRSSYIRVRKKMICFTWQIARVCPVIVFNRGRENTRPLPAGNSLQPDTKYPFFFTVLLFRFQWISMINYWFDDGRFHLI